MKRDAEGFPLSFELSSLEAEAWADAVERLRREKISAGQGAGRTKTSAPSVMRKEPK